MVCQRPLPQNPMARVRTLAKELAEGALGDVWGTVFPVDRGRIKEDKILEYLSHRWQSSYPKFTLLSHNGYLSTERNFFSLTQNAFALVEQLEPSTIFISYRRSESSTFALLVLARLKQAGLEPFLDMALEPGEDWQAGLKERIQSRDFFILLLGQTTLQSLYVVKEIEWALEKDLAILPIWQPVFEFSAADWPDLPDAVKHKLSNTHRIKVQEENPLEYDKALTELLNRFGITP